MFHAPWLSQERFYLSLCCILTPYLTSAMLEGFWQLEGAGSWGHAEEKLEGELSLLFKHLWALGQSCCFLEWLWLGGEALSPGPRAAEPSSALQGSLTLKGACKAGGR